MIPSSRPSAEAKLRPGLCQTFIKEEYAWRQEILVCIVCSRVGKSYGVRSHLVKFEDFHTPKEFTGLWPFYHHFPPCFFLQSAT